MELKAAWSPTSDDIANANITQFMSKLNIQDINDFHQWTVNHYPEFWEKIIDILGIVFKNPPNRLCDLKNGVETPRWLPGATMNIVDSCFIAPPSQTALIFQNKKNQLSKMTYKELDQFSNCIANSLVAQGLTSGDAIAIVMPMNVYAIAIYLGIIKMGGIVVSIADSFSSQEIITRLKIAKSKALFIQDYIPWSGKNIPLYEKIYETNAPKAIILPCDETVSVTLRKEDLTWDKFILQENNFISVACDPMQACNILFSSGTTAEPKAIPWNHTTPIKVASDAYFHQNIKPGDVLSWPTNLGWMMGPWLLFAAFINKASVAVYAGAPKDNFFGEFVQNAKVTMLGVVPTLVASWKQSKCMEHLDWNTIKVFSSTGECSNSEDMVYLMSLANNKPVIEYCGGTEIGGAYLSSTIIQKNYPSLFSTPVMGLNLVILDENGKRADEGEVAIIPPSIGLSTTLLNANHHEVYYDAMPTTSDGKTLRRHGDQIKRLPNGYYIILGRVDDTMNLGGIKISAAEIERTLIGLPDIPEVAAIGVTPSNESRNLLVIYAVTSANLDKKKIQQEMQKRINQHLNPLFKIHDVIFVKELPKTASNKIMRRVLRKNYM